MLPDSSKTLSDIVGAVQLEFSIPKGIYYIAPDENVHAGSLLVFHPTSRSMYVDDTFEIPPSKVFNAVLPEMGLHMTTKQALVDAPDAGKQYCDWVTELAHQWRDTSNFCAAHSGLVKFEVGGFEKALLTAIDNARPELDNS